MVKQNLISIILLGFAVIAYSQNKRDYVWQIGNKSNFPIAQSIEMNFSNSGLSIDTLIRPIGFEYFNASISSEQGYLLLYSNGCEIRDSKHRLIPGSKHLNPGQVDVDWCLNGYPVSEGGLFFSFFNDSSLMLLHQRVEVKGPPLVIVYDSLFYTTLRIFEGEYIVHEKTVPIIGGNLIGGNVETTKSVDLQAWWVIQAEKESNNYFTILIDSAKIDTLFKQTIGELSIDGSAAGQACFSPDGSLYAKYAPRDDLFLFDFNRADGTLSNFIKIHVADSGLIGGLAFSPNSRFLYVSSHVDLFQFDMWAENIENSKVHIGHYDGYLDPFPTNFYHMQLGPDCRIYMHSSNGGYSWHVIHQPDKKGLECQFEQHGILFPYSTSITMPNFPNYRLDTDPVCDPGLVDFIGETGNRSGYLYVFPNPTDGLVQLKIPEEIDIGESGLLEIRELTGNLLFTSHFENQDPHTISLDDLNPGIYFIIIQTKLKVYSAKVVKI